MLLFFIMGADKGIDSNLRSMIADYMENGFLENIIDMFKHDGVLYSLVGELIQDERVRVRLGTTALMEELRVKDKGNIHKAAQNILPLLDHDNPVVRGDVSNLLGIIGDKNAIPYLERALSDGNPDVRLIAEEAIEEIRQRFS